MTSFWTDRFADRVGYLEGGAAVSILKLAQRPDIISFAGGIPAPEFFPKQRVAEATRRLMESPQAVQALQYGVPEGYGPLREMVAEHMGRLGYQCSMENILITSGSQQGLDLIGKAFINPGERVLSEGPSYLGMFDAWRLYGAEFETVGTDDDGIIPEALEAALKAGPAKMMYLIPNFQNPTGICIPIERRKEIARISAQYGLGVVEDDPYGRLRYEGEDITPIISLDAVTDGSRGLTGNIIYMSTFSKTLCPGFRLAWLAAPVEVIERLAKVKTNEDLHTSTFSQAVAHELASGNFIEEHITMLRKVYSERRDLMLHLMEDTFPSELTWTSPAGGLFLWVRLPQGVSSVEVVKTAIEHGVAYVPGEVFFPHKGGENCLRLNYSATPPEKIEEGIRRLAIVFERACAAAALTNA